MGKVVVSDTNIFIDLIDIGLIKSLFQCGLEVHTTALVIEEIRNDAQRDELLSFTDLFVRKYQENDFRVVFDYFVQSNRYSNLSMADCSVLLYAKELDCPLLTNDGKLRHVAKGEGIEVRRLLWIVKNMVEAGALTKSAAKAAMQKLMETNNRAPMELIETFIKELAEEG